MMRAMALAALVLASAAAHADAALLERAHEAVKKELQNPQSAHFRNEVENKGKVCGEVTARDANGNYGGYAQYVYTGKGVIIAPLRGSKDDLMIDAVRRACDRVTAPAKGKQPPAK